jgi:hypothetical protein
VLTANNGRIVFSAAAPSGVNADSYNGHRFAVAQGMHESRGSSLGAIAVLLWPSWLRQRRSGLSGRAGIESSRT